MTRQEIISAINGLVSEYYGYDTTLDGIKSKSKGELFIVLNRWSNKVFHQNKYSEIMTSLALTENQRLAYSMGYKDALTIEQQSEYDRAMDHCKIATQ